MFIFYLAAFLLYIELKLWQTFDKHKSEILPMKASSTIMTFCKGM